MRASQALALMQSELNDPKTSEAQRVRLRRGIAAYAAANSPEAEERRERMGLLANTGSKITMQQGNRLEFSTIGGGPLRLNALGGEKRK